MNNPLQKQATPIYILSGFLGSGKTTLLQQMVSHWQEQGLRPAVIMNEIGDVNLEGVLIEETVPMTEMLSGCICCSIRGDLSLEIANLIHTESPDVIVVEATGIANPMEILDGVTEAALYIKIDLKSVITVVDAVHLLELYKEQKGQTYRLMQEQIRCASYLILNKIDRVNEEEQLQLRNIISGWNEFAPIFPTVRCDIDIDLLYKEATFDPSLLIKVESEEHEHKHMHHSHDHVMVYTHYFEHAIDSQQFEEWVSRLPREVYRAKGIISFSDTSSRFLFQYAFRESDFLKITPQGKVPDVAVFIGEHFSKSDLMNGLNALEKRGIVN
ncbi:CobW family GTP-binding protein [Paenibacillus sp. IHBB 10380]|uniref:CobW family GTP-binding protein n=1 Tax=Paenibacillus sp. IHBB 10380 TaxID=1566358 RepID=UPI0005CFABA2|nr:CobW family GTP-binding protein [Paenibacillus sp. IHBB 10380]AJS59082.1 cobalamin biosynthesis protein [Paenibacillus sp. IHBB 10380]